MFDKSDFARKFNEIPNTYVRVCVCMCMFEIEKPGQLSSTAHAAVQEIEVEFSTLDKNYRE